MTETTLAAAIEDYLTHLRLQRQLPANTTLAYGHDLAALQNYAADRSVTRCDQFDARLIAAFIAEQGQRLAPASLNRRLSACRQLLLYCQRRGLTPLQAEPSMPSLRVSRTLPLVLTVDQAVALMALPDTSTALGQRDRALLELLYGAGLRISEACALRVEDVSPGEGLVRADGKGGRTRLVPLGAWAEEAVLQYVAEGRRKLLGKHSSLYLFFGRPPSRPMSRMGAFKRVRAYGDQLGLLASLSPHALRHGFATHLMEGGADLRVVQELLGHRSLSTTEVYTHIATRELATVVERHHPLAEDGRPSLFRRKKS